MCWCHYFSPASSPGLPSLPPQYLRPHVLRAAPGWMQGKHVLTAMQTLSRSEPGKAGSGPAGGVNEGCREGCRGASSGWAGVPREGSPQCTRTIKPNAQLPSRSSRLPSFPERCGVGVSWSGRGRAGSVLRRQLHQSLSLPQLPTQQPGRGERGGDAGGRAGRPEFPTTRGRGGRGAGTMTQTPPPTTAAGRDCHRHLPLSSQGNPWKATTPRGPKAGLPGRASLRVLGPPAAHNAPGPRCGHRSVVPGVPSAARTPTGKTSNGAADGVVAATGGGRRPRRTGARAGRGAEARAPPAWSRGLRHPQRRRRRRRCASSGPRRRSPSSPTGGARWRGGAPGSPPPAPAGWRSRSGTAGSPDLLDTFSEPPGEPRAGRAEPRDSRGSHCLGSPPAGPGGNTPAVQRPQPWSPLPGKPGPERRRNDPVRPSSSQRRWTSPGSHGLAQMVPALGARRAAARTPWESGFGREQQPGHLPGDDAQPPSRAFIQVISKQTGLRLPAPSRP